MARIPKPERVANLHGKRNSHRTGVEPKPNPDHPDCPEHLSDEAQEHWYETCQRLDEMGLLSKTDADSIRIYVEATDRYRRYERFIAANGESYLLSNGFLQTRTEVNLMYKNLEICRRYQIEFGFTPSARSRVAIQSRKAVSDWDDILNDEVEEKKNSPRK